MGEKVRVIHVEVSSICNVQAEGLKRSRVEK